MRLWLCLALAAIWICERIVAPRTPNGTEMDGIVSAITCFYSPLRSQSHTDRKVWKIHSDAPKINTGDVWLANVLQIEQKMDTSLHGTLC